MRVLFHWITPNTFTGHASGNQGMSRVIFSSATLFQSALSDEQVCLKMLSKHWRGRVADHRAVVTLLPDDWTWDRKTHRPEPVLFLVLVASSIGDENDDDDDDDILCAGNCYHYSQPWRAHRHTTWCYSRKQNRVWKSPHIGPLVLAACNTSLCEWHRHK